MSGVPDAYALTHQHSARLKLRAKRLLAEGTDASVFDACVILHEAARVEHGAVRALTVCPPETRLGALVERCWCLIEGRDPPEASEAWADIVRVRPLVEASTANALLARVAPRYEDSSRRFADAVRASTALLAVSSTRSLDHLPTKLRRQAQEELATVLEAFPGARSFRWLEYRLADASGQPDRAWEALEKARRLAPQNRRYLAMSLLLAAHSFSADKAEEYLAQVADRLGEVGAEVCLMYALAELSLSEKAGSTAQRRVRRQRALDAASAGSSQARTGSLRNNLQAVRMLAGELLAGRTPTLELLYQSGLAEKAASAPPGASVMALLTESARGLAA
jgi:tetratricopeptide (TPR) repeat protein